MKRIVKALGVTHVVSDSESKILQRGMIDPYDLSDEPNEWVVLKPYVFWSHDIGRVIIVPRWFITDLASIPKIFRSFISVNERHRFASLPHDMLYVLSSIGEYNMSRAKADKVLLTFCELMGVPAWKRWTMYLAVRAGAWTLFGKKGKRMFIPSSHRLFYLDSFPELGLRPEDGEYESIL